MGTEKSAPRMPRFFAALGLFLFVFGWATRCKVTPQFHEEPIRYQLYTEDTAPGTPVFLHIRAPGPVLETQEIQAERLGPRHSRFSVQLYTRHFYIQAEDSRSCPVLLHFSASQRRGPSEPAPRFSQTRSDLQAFVSRIRESDSEGLLLYGTAERCHTDGQTYMGTHSDSPGSGEAFTDESFPGALNGQAMIRPFLGAVPKTVQVQDPSTYEPRPSR